MTTPLQRIKDLLYPTKSSLRKINFEGMQNALAAHPRPYIINTMKPNEQDCLILYTINIAEEEKLINGFMDNDQMKAHIIIYGRNAADTTADYKYHQLVSLGFENVELYGGGMFEWLLLQDIYGEMNFPTTKRVLDLLAWR